MSEIRPISRVKLNERQKLIIKEIRKNPDIWVNQLFNKLKRTMSKDTLLKEIGELERFGIIKSRYIGNSKSLRICARKENQRFESIEKPELKTAIKEIYKRECGFKIYFEDEINSINREKEDIIDFNTHEIDFFTSTKTNEPIIATEGFIKKVAIKMGVEPDKKFRKNYFKILRKLRIAIPVYKLRIEV